MEKVGLLFVFRPWFMVCVLADWSKSSCHPGMEKALLKSRKEFAWFCMQNIPIPYPDRL